MGITMQMLFQRREYSEVPTAKVCSSAAKVLFAMRNLLCKGDDISNTK
jgi:hypothetical protein